MTEAEEASDREFRKIAGKELLFIKSRLDSLEAKRQDKIIRYRSIKDSKEIKVREMVVLKSSRMKDYFINFRKKNPETNTILLPIPGINIHTLYLVIRYCYSHKLVNFREIDIISLLNLIQAAHFLDIEDLMNTSCSVLGNRLKELMSSSSPRFQDDRFSSLDGADRLLRSRTIETFINHSDFLDVHFSPFVLSELRFIMKGKPTLDEHHLMFVRFRSAKGLLQYIQSFEKFIRGDPRSAYLISASAVRYLIEILKETDYSKDHRDDIQRPIISILSHARFDICGDVMEDKLLPVLVGFVSDLRTGLVISAVIALTRIAYAFPKHIKVIVDKGALEAAENALQHHFKLYWIMEYLAKFLATISRGYCFSCSSDKVAKILTILDRICHKWSYKYQLVHTYTCYALSYLSHEKVLILEEKLWDRFQKRLVDYISCYRIVIPGTERRIGMRGKLRRNENSDQMLAGSALGVVGHIMRWGNQAQIQSLSEYSQFWVSLRSMLCSFKKFRKEALQIISNMAARRILIPDEVITDVVKHCCGSVEDVGSDSDVKMEAAWAAFNIICARGLAVGTPNIDEYPT